MTVKIIQSKVAGYARSSKKFLASGISSLSDINYKNIRLLSKFTSEQGKIIPRRISGTTAKIQRLITREIKRARILALLPFSRSDKPGPRGEGGRPSATHGGGTHESPREDRHNHRKEAS